MSCTLENEGAAIMAHARQSRQVAGLGFQVTVLATFQERLAGNTAGETARKSGSFPLNLPADAIAIDGRGHRVHVRHVTHERDRV